MLIRSNHPFPTALAEIREKANQLRLKYTHSNPERLKWVGTINQTLLFLEQLDPSAKEAITEKELVQVGFGAFLSALAIIEKEYHLLNPKLNKKFGLQSGSLMYHILVDELGFNELKDADEDYFICAEKFYNFLFNNVYSLKEMIEEHFKKTGLVWSDLKKNCLYALRLIMGHMKLHITHFMHALPEEKKIDQRLSEIRQKYQSEKDKTQGYVSFFKSKSANRSFQVQLLDLIPAVLADQKSEDPAHFQVLSRSMRVKIGALLIVIQSINQESHLPFSKQYLRDLCLEALNIHKLQDIDVDTQLGCLTALSNFLKDNNQLSRMEQLALEKYKKENALQPIDPKIAIIHAELDRMIANVLQMNHITNWPATHTLSHLMEILCSAPGYGLGWVAGYMASDSTQAIKPKVQISKGINYASTAFLGLSRSNWMGYFAANIIGEQILTRAFAKLFECFGKLIGRTTGGAVGLVFDLSYKGLRQLCHAYLHIAKQFPEVPEKNIEFIESLLRLPEELFSDHNKKLMADLYLEEPGPAEPPYERIAFRT